MCPGAFGNAGRPRAVTPVTRAPKLVQSPYVNLRAHPTPGRGFAGRRPGFGAAPLRSRLPSSRRSAPEKGLRRSEQGVLSRIGSATPTRCEALTSGLIPLASIRGCPARLRSGCNGRIAMLRCSLLIGSLWIASTAGTAHAQLHVVVAENGDPAVGPVKLPANEGASFAAFGDPAIGADGTVGFPATLTGAPNHTTESVWASDRVGSGARLLRLVAREGDAAPGTPVGVVFNAFAARSAVVGRDGRVAFEAVLRGTGVELFLGPPLPSFLLHRGGQLRGLSARAGGRALRPHARRQHHLRLGRRAPREHGRAGGLQRGQARLEQVALASSSRSPRPRCPWRGPSGSRAWSSCCWQSAGYAAAGSPSGRIPGPPRRSPR